MPVDSPSYDALALERWTRCRTVAEGSDAVKKAGQTYLPALDSHRTSPTGGQKYLDYVQRALFYNGTGRTIEGLAGGIFQKAPTAKVPTSIEGDLKDITLTNEPIDLFALTTVKEVLTVGRAGILVDMAKVDEATKTATPPRPYWARYRAEDIVSWRVSRIGGDQVLTRVVLRESKEDVDPKDEFATVTTVQYRVLQINDAGQYVQQVYTPKADNPKEFVPGELVVVQRRGVPLSFIPFVFIGPTSVSPNVEKPPLLDLVDVNLSHYRSMADLEHGRHLTALPTPWVAGMQGAKDNAPLAIGSGEAWMLEKEGRAGMLEYTGQGLGALDKADEQKRKMMATLGARLLDSQGSQQEAARTVEMRFAGEHATLRTIAQASEGGLTLCLQFHAWWVGTEERPSDTEAQFELNKQFFIVKATPDEVRVLVLALQADAISFETFYAGLQRGEWARPGITAEQEQAAIQAAIDAREPEPDPAPEQEPNPDGDPEPEPEPEPEDN